MNFPSAPWAPVGSCASICACISISTRVALFFHLHLGLQYFHLHPELRLVLFFHQHPLGGMVPPILPKVQLLPYYQYTSFTYIKFNSLIIESLLFLNNQHFTGPVAASTSNNFPPKSSRRSQLDLVVNIQHIVLWWRFFMFLAIVSMKPRFYIINKYIKCLTIQFYRFDKCYCWLT